MWNKHIHYCDMSLDIHVEPWSDIGSRTERSRSTDAGMRDFYGQDSFI